MSRRRLAAFDTVPDVLGPAAKPEFRWRGPEGDGHEGNVAIVVSKNPYRLTGAMGSGTRPRLDQGVLGVAVLGAPGEDAGVREWAAAAFEIEAHAPVPAGVDGEALVFEPPLRFRIRPALPPRHSPRSGRGQPCAP